MPVVVVRGSDAVQVAQRAARRSAADTAASRRCWMIQRALWRRASWDASLARRLAQAEGSVSGEGVGEVPALLLVSSSL